MPVKSLTTQTTHEPTETEDRQETKPTLSPTFMGEMWAWVTYPCTFWIWDRFFSATWTSSAPTASSVSWGELWSWGDESSSWCLYFCNRKHTDETEVSWTWRMDGWRERWWPELWLTDGCFNLHAADSVSTSRVHVTELQTSAVTDRPESHFKKKCENTWRICSCFWRMCSDSQSEHFRSLMGHKLSWLNHQNKTWTSVSEKMWINTTGSLWTWKLRERSQLQLPRCTSLTNIQSQSSKFCWLLRKTNYIYFGFWADCGLNSFRKKFLFYSHLTDLI